MRLRLRDRTLEIRRGQPILMGIVNATPDSFSDRQGAKDPSELVERALELVEHGAAIVDVGGESGRTDRPPVTEDEEAARVVPVVERLATAGIAVSVDTWRPGPGPSRPGRGRRDGQRRERPGRARGWPSCAPPRVPRW